MKPRRREDIRHLCWHILQTVELVQRQPPTQRAEHYATINRKVREIITELNDDEDSD